MENDKKISDAVIKRLPRYYRYLDDLLVNGITRISSKELSNKMDVTASQIRQDLNNFGGFGQQGYGYNVEVLYSEIKKILGLDKQYNIIIIGAGNLGQALSNYSNFIKRGFIIKAMFDINPRLVGMSIRGIEVMDIDTLQSYVTNNHIDIAILTLPAASAAATANNLAAWGVPGIWNFSPIDIGMLPNNAIVENVHLTDNLMTLSYRLRDK